MGSNYILNLLLFNHSILKCLLSLVEKEASCFHNAFLQILFGGSKLPQKCVFAQCLAKFCLAAMLFSVPNLTQEGGGKEGEEERLAF